MPWCFECQAYRAPSAVRRDGTCPRCGLPVDLGRLAEARAAGARAATGEEAETLPPVPWHLKLLGVAVAGYLGVRAWQGIEWVARRIGG